MIRRILIILVIFSTLFIFSCEKETKYNYDLIATLGLIYLDEPNGTLYIPESNRMIMEMFNLFDNYPTGTWYWHINNGNGDSFASSFQPNSDGYSYVDYTFPDSWDLFADSDRYFEIILGFDPLGAIEAFHIDNYGSLEKIQAWSISDFYNLDGEAIYYQNAIKLIVALGNLPPLPDVDDDDHVDWTYNLYIKSGSDLIEFERISVLWDDPWEKEFSDISVQEGDKIFLCVEPWEATELYKICEGTFSSP